MKVYFNRQIRRSPYGGGAHFLSGYADYLTSQGHHVVDTLEPGIDVIYMMDPRPENNQFPGWDVLKRYKVYFPKTKVIHRVNDTDKARGVSGQLEPLIILANHEVADATIFISNWVKNHYTPLGYQSKNRPEIVIYNGCNEEWFKPKKYKALKDPVKLVTHHWSDNPNKGADVYQWIDQHLIPQNPGRFEFTYIGRYSKGLIPQNVKIIPPLYGKELGDELRKHDIYVTGARWEACGMHHIEGAACGLPVIYHIDGGGINEICNTKGSFSCINGLIDALGYVISDYKNMKPTNVKTSQECYSQYLKFTQQVIDP